MLLITESFLPNLSRASFDDGFGACPKSVTKKVWTSLEPVIKGAKDGSKASKTITNEVQLL